MKDVGVETGNGCWICSVHILGRTGHKRATAAPTLNMLTNQKYPNPGAVGKPNSTNKRDKNRRRTCEERRW